MEGTNTFTVLPMSQRISLTPGEVYEGSITVVNPASATNDFLYRVEVTPYGVKGENYDIDLVTDSDRTAISKWIEIDEPTGTIRPNESKEVKFTITVPDNAPGGGQYATIAISSNNDISNTEGFAVQNVFEVASIIYADVAGETIHDGSILENNIPSFALVTPIKTSATLTNNGNIHENATITITVRNLFTGQDILPTEANDGRYSEMVMPDTTHYIEREISDLPTIGIVKVSQTIYYNGQTSALERDIIICPIWFMILIVIALSTIVGTIVHLVKKRRHKKKNIIV